MSEPDAVVAPRSEAVTEVSDGTEKTDEFAEPEVKRRKLIPKEAEESKNRLEDKLGGILCCAVCLDLPKAAVYQVSQICLRLGILTFVCLLNSVQ